MTIKTPSHFINKDIIYETLALLYKNEKSTISEVEKYIKKSRTIALSSVKTLRMIGCFKNDESFELNDFVKNAVKNHLPKRDSGSLLKELLMLWDPFIVFLDYLKSGYDYEQSNSKLCVFYKFDKEKQISEYLKKWMTDLNIKIDRFDTVNGNEKETKLLEKKIESLVYVKHYLGGEIYSFIDKEIKTELLESILKIHSNPRDSMKNSGGAYEDFLRVISSKHGYLDDLKKLSGISQISNKLVSFGFIDSKHNNISVSIGELRNMVGHNKDKSHMLKWKVDENTANLLFHMVLISIKSIYNYVENSKHLSF